MRERPRLVQRLGLGPVCFTSNGADEWCRRLLSCRCRRCSHGDQSLLFWVELGHALGDDASTPRYLRTAHRVGYGFIGCGDAGEDGTPTAFNDLGQLAFRAMFKDGTEGVFVATVPEPGAAVEDEGVRLVVEEVEGNRITRVRVVKIEAPETPADGASTTPTEADSQV